MIKKAAKTYLSNFLSLSLLVVCISCGGFGSSFIEIDENKVGQHKIEAEAYLFDVKIRRQGKPTSLRLDLYQTDSVIAMFGRAYFNKGAFRGRLTSDSLNIFFPASNEFLQESIDALFGSFNCQGNLSGLPVFKYFSELPDSALSETGLEIKTLINENKKKSFEISASGCGWLMSLKYQKEDKGWRLNEFKFDDKQSVRIKGSRRIYKSSARIPSGRFELAIPSDSYRITI
ncbi:MAG: hypothetical protein IID63_04035 [candidate division Zixibacteria bacterium]|nr:hypothetical protein [candidate division Zixibacteria bacterium]